MEQEIWKDIPEMGGLYQVSNLGRVRNVKNGRTFTGCVDAHGYCASSLNLGNDKYRRIKVHRVVAEAFVPNPNNLPFVNHKDEDKTNNRADNLEWCNNLYNLRYGNAQKKMSENSGRKVAVEVFDKQGNKLNEYNSINEAADGLGITRSFIRKLILGKCGTRKNIVIRVKDMDTTSKKAKATALEVIPRHLSAIMEKDLIKRRKSFAMGYDRANADALAWMEEHLIDILDGAGDRSEVISAFKKYIEK